jgi:hypothetical protein
MENLISKWKKLINNKENNLEESNYNIHNNSNNNLNLSNTSEGFNFRVNIYI